jgi:uncharacterized membrane protein
MSEEKKTSEKITVLPTNRQKNIAAISYIFFIIGYFTVEKDSPFVKFHMKQSLTLLVFTVAISIIGIIPLLGWLIAFFGSILSLILFVIGIINALSGEEKELPLIGKYAKNFSL